MPVHREVLVNLRELERAEEHLAETIGALKADVLGRDLDPALERLEALRQRADELEAALLRVEP